MECEEVSSKALIDLNTVENVTSSSNATDEEGNDHQDQDALINSPEEIQGSSISVTKNEPGFISPTFVAPKRIAIKKKSPGVIQNKTKGRDDFANAYNKADDLNCKSEPSSSNLAKNNEKSEAGTNKSQATESNKSDAKLQIPYKPPQWCSVCVKSYSFEILKNGVMKGKLDLTEKPFYIFGRLEGCDVLMEHPSISRYHAAVVYKGNGEVEGKGSKIEEGFYIMDLGSTHGTVVNKTALQPKVYHRIRVGYVIKFGGSSRLYVLQGPNDDQDEEVEMNIIKEVSKTDDQVNEEDETGKDRENDEEDGISWGMGEDAVEEEIDLEKLLASRKPLELKDPKKTLRGFFEREGLDLEYDADEKGTGSSKVFVVRVRLPIEDANGEELIAEGTSTKKKDAVVACAYEACRIIDAHGMLRNATHESERSKRAKRLAENDYYDSDEDSFLDRTGTVESKRRKRLRKAGKAEEENVETFETLSESLEKTAKEISSLERSLEDDKIAEKRMNEEGIDELDQFMSAVGSRLDKKTRISIKHRLSFLRKEQRRIERLIEIVKPAKLPALQVPQATVSEKKRESTTKIDQNEVNENVENVKAKNFDRRGESNELDKVEGNKSKQPSNAKKPAVGSMVDVISKIGGTINETMEEEKSEEFRKPKKKEKKKVYGPQAVPSSDTKFADWVPPVGQTGDGKTHLNERFGY